MGEGGIGIGMGFEQVGRVAYVAVDLIREDPGAVGRLLAGDLLGASASYRRVSAIADEDILVMHPEESVLYTICTEDRDLVTAVAKLISEWDANGSSRNCP